MSAHAGTDRLDPRERCAAPEAPGHTVVLTPRAASGPAASCVCLHESRVLVKGLEPGDYELEIDTGEQRTVLGSAGRGLVSERVYATGRVSVR